MKHDWLVVGIGNELRRDDGAGLEVARRLRAAGVEAREMRGDLSLLVPACAGRRGVIVIDAVRTGAEPGTVHRFEAGAAPLPASCARRSTHAIGVAEAIEMARALGSLPAPFVVYGIEGGDFSSGAGLSAAAARGVEAAAARVATEVQSAPARF